MLDEMDAASPAKLARADPDGAFEYQTISRAALQPLEKLPPEQVEAWVNLPYNASVPQLNGQPEIELDPQLFDDTFATWMQSLPPDQTSRMRQMSNDFPDINNTDAC